MPFEEERPAVETPPLKVELPVPLTVMTLPTEKLVDDATGRMEEPITRRPPASTVSPDETRSPPEESKPAAERPPVKVDVPVPETVSRLVIAAEPSLA